MTSSPVRVRVLRALVLHGDRIPAGRELEVSALEAQLLLESTRAELVDSADLQRVRTAVGAQTASLLRREKSAQRGGPGDGNGWRHL